MPLLLYAYLASEILGPLFASLLIINAILFLGKLSSFLEVIFSFGVGFSDFFRISSYLIPNLMLFSIPMASTISVIIAFSRLAGDNEILALKASGTGLYKMLPPVIIIALFTSALTASASWSLIPKSSMAMKKTMYQLAKEKVDKGLRPREFSDSVKDIVIYIDKINNEDDSWQGVYIADRRDRKNPLTILAKSGKLTPHLNEMLIVLNLNDGSIHRSKGENSQTIQFESYQLQLPVNFGTQAYADGTYIKSAHKTDLTPFELSEKIDEYKAASLASNDQRSQEQYKSSMTSMLLEFHKRLTLPIGCFILTLLALPLALQSRPGRRPVGLPLGLFFFALYYILLTVAKSTAEVSSFPVWAIMWSPNLLFGILTILLIRISARENSIRYLEKMIDLSRAFMSVLKKRSKGAASEPS